MSFPTYADLVRRFGLAFRPDLLAYQYRGHPAAYPDGAVVNQEAEVHDGVVRAAFANHESGAQGPADPYAAALAVWREDGLLGANDPGPAPFRDAHWQYLEARSLVKMSAEHGTIAIRRAKREHDAIDTSDIPEATEADFARVKLRLPRPRLGFNELLDAVNEFNRNTSPLRLNVRTLGSFDAVEREFNVHQTRLRDWFEERGITVDPT